MTRTPKEPGQICLQGHRAWRGKFPENSKIAFEKVLELGVTTIELDVVPGPDNSLWVWHDPFLGELFENPYVSKALNSYTQLELEASVFGLKAHPLFKEQQPVASRMMRLEELIEWWQSFGAERPWLNIEIKSKPEWEGVFQPSVSAYAENLLDALPAECGKLHLQSFDLRFLLEIEALSAHCSLGWLVEDGEALKHFFDQPHAFDAIGISHELIDIQIVDKCTELNLELMVWTVNDVLRASTLHQMGVRNFITDYPDKFKSWMTESSIELRSALI